MIMKKDDCEIDFVLTWVDNTDPIWQEQFNFYKSKTPNANKSNAADVSRFRDWGLLKYWFRSIEMYTPWVRKIFFVTCGQHPSWLNTDNQRLVLVDHKDYIPKQYLPCFSSRPIELNFHRINDLSEYFIYFNDDEFVLKKRFSLLMENQDI